MGKRPATPTIDAATSALLDWGEANAGRPALVVDDETFDVLRHEADALMSWNERERMTAEPEVGPETSMYLGGYPVVLRPDLVDGWEWRDRRDT